MEEDETTGKVKVVKATKNATMMRHPITKNRIIIKSKATNYESALSLARGLTAPSNKVAMYLIWYWTNLFNCWEIFYRQSAAKTQYE